MLHLSALLSVLVNQLVSHLMQGPVGLIGLDGEVEVDVVPKVEAGKVSPALQLQGILAGSFLVQLGCQVGQQVLLRRPVLQQLPQVTSIPLLLMHLQQGLLVLLSPLVNISVKVFQSRLLVTVVMAALHHNIHKDSCSKEYLQLRIL